MKLHSTQATVFPIPLASGVLMVGLYVYVHPHGNSPYCISVYRFRVVLSELSVYGSLGINYFCDAVPACFCYETRLVFVREGRDSALNALSELPRSA